LLLLTLRSFGAIPEAAIAPMHVTANFLTIMSMAALGLGVVRAQSVRAGCRVAAVVVLGRWLALACHQVFS